MSTPDGNVRVRQWQEITEEASHESDPKRLTELAEELNRALDERDKQIGLIPKRKSESAVRPENERRVSS